jgi:hypothetical protein
MSQPILSSPIARAIETYDGPTGIHRTSATCLYIRASTINEPSECSKFDVKRTGSNKDIPQFVIDKKTTIHNAYDITIQHVYSTETFFKIIHSMVTVGSKGMEVITLMQRKSCCRVL